MTLSLCESIIVTIYLNDKFLASAGQINLISSTKYLIFPNSCIKWMWQSEEWILFHRRMSLLFYLKWNNSRTISLVYKSNPLLAMYAIVFYYKVRKYFYLRSLGIWWMQTWWSTDILITLQSLNPRIASASSVVGKNSSPVINVLCEFSTLLTFYNINKTVNNFNSVYLYKWYFRQKRLLEVFNSFLPLN